MFLCWVIFLLLGALSWFPSSSHAQALRVSYSGLSGQNLPFWITYEAGLYKKYGLSAEMLLISGGLTNIQAVMANEIGFTYLGGAATLQAAVQGADIVILATAYGLMPYGMKDSTAQLQKFGCEIISDPGVIPIKFRAPGGTVAEIVPKARYKKPDAQS